MAKCPLCEEQVRDDFGLIECGGCGAQLIVHMDGRVEYSGAKVHEGFEPEEKESLTGTKIQAAFESPEATFPSLPQAREPQLEAQLAPESEAESEKPPAEIFLAGDLANAESSDDTVLIAPAIYDATEVHVVPTAGDSPDLSDIARFGNSTANSTREGSLRYNLMITGIDTSDVRESFRDAITDRKLMWDTDQILRSIKNGEVRILSVPPAKAFIVVSRMRNLPVQMTWEQYVVAQT